MRIIATEELTSIRGRLLDNAPTTPPERPRRAVPRRTGAPPPVLTPDESAMIHQRTGEGGGPDQKRSKQNVPMINQVGVNGCPPGLWHAPNDDANHCTLDGAVQPMTVSPKHLNSEPRTLAHI